MRAANDQDLVTTATIGFFSNLVGMFGSPALAQSVGVDPYFVVPELVSTGGSLTMFVTNGFGGTFTYSKNNAPANSNFVVEPGFVKSAQPIPAPTAPPGTLVAVVEMFCPSSAATIQFTGASTLVLTVPGSIDVSKPTMVYVYDHLNHTSPVKFIAETAGTNGFEVSMQNLQVSTNTVVEFYFTQ